MTYHSNLGDISAVPCRHCGVQAGERCTSGTRGTPQPHAARKADFRASHRDLEADLAALTDRHRQVVELARYGLKNQRAWSARPPGGKFTRLASTVVEDLERWGVLERTQGRGRELSLSPYGEQVLARMETR